MRTLCTLFAEEKFTFPTAPVHVRGHKEAVQTKSKLIVFKKANRPKHLSETEDKKGGDTLPHTESEEVISSSNVPSSARHSLDSILAPRLCLHHPLPRPCPHRRPHPHSRPRIHPHLRPHTVRKSSWCVPWTASLVAVFIPIHIHSYVVLS